MPQSSYRAFFLTSACSISGLMFAKNVLLAEIHVFSMLVLVVSPFSTKIQPGSFDCISEMWTSFSKAPQDKRLRSWTDGYLKAR
jgi:hypothetical protein